MNPEIIPIRIDNGGKNNLAVIIITIILTIIAAVVIWWEVVEVVRLIEEGSCERIVSEGGRSSYPTRLKCS
jgi:hypothetical protein